MATTVQTTRGLLTRDSHGIVRGRKEHIKLWVHKLFGRLARRPRRLKPQITIANTLGRLARRPTSLCTQSLCMFSGPCKYDIVRGLPARLQTMM